MDVYGRELTLDMSSGATLDERVCCSLVHLCLIPGPIHISSSIQHHHRTSLALLSNRSPDYYVSIAAEGVMLEERS